MNYLTAIHSRASICFIRQTYSLYTRLHRNQYVVKRTSNREQIDDTGLREDFDLTEKFSKNKKEERERERKRKELKSKRARSVMAERRGGR